MVASGVVVPEAALTMRAVRSSGPGGQNVNKLSTAVQLRFDVRRTPSLPNDVAVRLMRLAGKRMTKDGVLVLIAQNHRTQERNRAEARERLFALIEQAAHSFQIAGQRLRRSLAGARTKSHACMFQIDNRVVCLLVFFAQAGKFL